jgi:hypothetical protein
MSKNKRKPKKPVRSKKGEPEITTRQVDIVSGNTAILTVKFLNEINNHLIDIKQMLKDR